MILHLIRHGQTDWNAIRRVQGQTESELDDTGKAQASALGQQLADVAFTRVHVSSSVRTRQTAERLFDNRNLPTEFADDLREMRLGRTSVDANIAIVSHGFLLRAILARYLGLPLQAFAGSTGLPNCAHNIVEVHEDTRHVKTIAGEPPTQSLWRDIIATARS